MRRFVGAPRCIAAVLLLAVCTAPAYAVSCRVRTSPLSPADIAMAQGDYAKAATLYDQERKVGGPEGDRTHAAMIRALLRDDKVPAADKEAAAWSNAQPSSAWANVALAEVQWREGRDEDALNSIRKVLSLDPCNPQVHADLAHVYAATGMHASARLQFTVAHQLDPIDDDIYGRWLHLQPRSEQLAQLTQYLDRASFLSGDERKSLTRWKDRLSQPSSSSCHLASPLSSTSIPFHGIQDGPDAPIYWGLEVAFNGKQRRLEIDTGASGLLLTKAAAAALHLQPENDFKLGGFGDEGEVDSYAAKVKSIKIGDLEFEDCYVQVLSKTPKGMESEDGLIGGDVFSQFLLTLDFPGRTLKLAPLPPRPGLSSSASSASLQTGVSSEDLPPQDRYIDASMKDWTSVYRSGHNLILHVRIDKGPPRLFIVDSGAQTDLISPEAARQVGKISEESWMQIYGISGQVKKTYSTGPLKLRFGQLEYPSYGMTAVDLDKFSNDVGMEISGFMGSPILHQLTVTIDYRDNLVNLSYDPKRITRCGGGYLMGDCY